MNLSGLTVKLGNDVNTDVIIPGKYTKTLDMQALAAHVFEDIDPSLRQRCAGKIVVAGENFGLGSSREHAPIAIKEAGVLCVLAQSFSRLFFRNAINIGLPVFICDTTNIQENDLLNIDGKAGLVQDETSGEQLKIYALPAVMQEIIDDGGLVEHFRLGKGFDF